MNILSWCSIPKSFAGCVFNLCTSPSPNVCVTCDMEVRFGKYCSIKPLVFPFVPRPHKWWEVAK